MPITNSSYKRHVTPFVSAARTTHASSNSFNTNNNTSARFDVNISAFTGTSITFTFEGYDPDSDSWVTLLASAALSAVAHTAYFISPFMTAAANVTAAAVLPKKIRVTPSGTITTVTYSVGLTLD